MKVEITSLAPCGCRRFLSRRHFAAEIVEVGFGRLVRQLVVLDDIGLAQDDLEHLVSRVPFVTHEDADDGNRVVKGRRVFRVVVIQHPAAIAHHGDGFRSSEQRLHFGAGRHALLDLIHLACLDFVAARGGGAARDEREEEDGRGQAQESLHGVFGGWGFRLWFRC